MPRIIVSIATTSATMLTVSTYSSSPRPGGDDIAKPPLAETPGVGAHTMNDLNDGLGQFVEAVVLALDRCRQQRFLASAAQRAIRGAARLGSDHRHFSGLEVS